MIKFFRKIRQNLLSEGKTGKYFKYAIGEILLVVIGILIALQLNNWNEKKNKTKLGYEYLTEMKSELQDDALKIDLFIFMLKKDLENQEAALNTKDINKLPLDSLKMIINLTNLDFKISELTFNKMNNLGLTALSNNDSLNSKISKYYNSDVVFLKTAMSYIFDELIKREKFYYYEQDKIDFSEREFPSIYKESKEEFEIVLKSSIVNYAYSIKGRNLISQDLDGKRYSLRVLSGFQKSTTDLLKTIYDDLKIYNPQIEPLPTFYSEMDFKEITLSQDILKKYIGKYQSENNDVVNVLIENMRIYVKGSRKTEIFPYEEDKFFVKDLPFLTQFNKEKGEIISMTTIVNGKKTDAIKIE